MYLQVRHNIPTPLQVDLRPFDLENGIRMKRDVGYPQANFGLPGPLYSRVIPDVRDRETSDSIIT